MGQATRELIDNETPFRVIEIHDANGARREIRLYWTESPDAYGYQVAAVVFGGGELIEYETNYCGCRKEDDATTAVLRAIGVKPRVFAGNSHGVTDKISLAYHVGGNFYRVPKSKTVKFK